jgi:hypothetical protein
MRQRQLKDFLGAGHPGTLVSAFVYFTVSTVVWVMIGLSVSTSPRISS